jgi:phosphoribosylamine--glycine ligase
VLLPRLETDLLDLLLASATGGLRDVKVDWRGDAAVTVVCASGGYPGEYGTGTPIKGLDKAGKVDGVTVFHSGTAERDGTVVTAGGRVLAVTATGEDLTEARDRAYEGCKRISFDGMHFRTDIAAAAARGTR